MLGKNKENNNAKSTVMVCLIGAVVLMGVLTGRMMKRFNIKYNGYKTGR